MRVRLTLFILILALPNLSFAQNCSCADNFKWLKETFEKNDAGFQYVIDQKGEAEYKKHSDLYAKKAKSINNSKVCVEILQNWLRFFRKGHLWIGLNKKDESARNDLDSEKINAQFENWETYPFKKEEFNSYISKIKNPGLEGIWTSPPYTIGIKKVGDEYIGFIIESDEIYWSESQIKFKITDKNNDRRATYYMQDHTPREMKRIELLGDNYLQMDFIIMKRLSPTFPSNKNLDMYFKFLKTEIPLFEKLNDKTTILRIPNFSLSEKVFIDSIIEANKNIILNTQNLIIDLRYNDGGSDASYESLIPIIYTNLIKTIGVELLSTPINNQRMLDFIDDPDFPEEYKTWAQESREKLNENLGEFVEIDDPIEINETFDTIYAYPKNVGIIINHGNASTAEQFLLAAKQSKKVKLFGTTTSGVLDISNMNFIESPCNDLKLGYSISKSKRIPEFTIDGKGIQPDFYIDKSIPQYEWIDYINNILSEEF